MSYTEMNLLVREGLVLLQAFLCILWLASQRIEKEET